MRQNHYLPKMRINMECFDDIELARGYFHEYAFVEGQFFVSGWMLLPDKDFSSILVYWNGELVGSADMELRQDVAKAFPWISHASRSGFSFRLPKPITERTRVGRVDLLGCRDSRPIARLSTLLRTDLDANIPSPPAVLLDRIGTFGNARYFKLGGLTLFGDVMEAIRRHWGPGPIRRLLDWGCGCGRVSVHFLSEPDIGEVFGCDVDVEAVEWCGEHLQPGNFSRIEPWPPTPYEDATFDVIVGISVFTHLSRDVQNAWLAEMKRIIVPGGLFLASTHGQFAASFAFPETFAELLRDGIFSNIHNPSLNGIAPVGYYRDVYQTREYTIREWSKYFEISDYIERGMGNHQDLVVMRRPA